MELNKNQVYTYEDYLKTPEGDVFEILDGQVFNHPAPSRIHQDLIMEISSEIRNYIKSNNGPCKVYTAPFDVVLVNEGEIENSSKNVVQPDISVICDKNKLTDKGCTGTPDMIIEIVSPSNASHDYVKKLFLYEKYGVKEYWIVNPMEKVVSIFSFNGQRFGEPKQYTFDDKIKVNIYNDLDIDFKSLNLE
ncbi:Uma2 family endonuclease [Clostridium ihumii]|uniref:Uma2 family endonuclease n=1 Tax=Clostridium ihumii TaxID=1470356 RepID=UPI00058C8AE4|nr:Uma2 family endonuclease [Clostridium ihumii]